MCTDCSCDSLCCVIIGVIVCCEARESVFLGKAALHGCDCALCEVMFVCLLNEWAEVDTHLVGNWVVFPILDVALVKVTSPDGVKGIEEELLGWAGYIFFTRVAIS